MGTYYILTSLGVASTEVTSPEGLDRLIGLVDNMVRDLATSQMAAGDDPVEARAFAESCIQLVDADGVQV